MPSPDQTCTSGLAGGCRLSRALCEVDAQTEALTVHCSNVLEETNRQLRAALQLVECASRCSTGGNLQAEGDPNELLDERTAAHHPQITASVLRVKFIFSVERYIHKDGIAFSSSSSSSSRALQTTNKSTSCCTCPLFCSMFFV